MIPISLIYNTIKEKLGSATEKEKQFYGHLREYLSKNSCVALTSSDLNKIQTFMGRFESIVEALKNASDDFDVDFYTGMAQCVARECEKELPVMKVKSEEN